MVAISTTHMGINDRTLLRSSNRRIVAVTVVAMTVVAMTTVLDRVSNGCNNS